MKRTRSENARQQVTEAICDEWERNTRRKFEQEMQSSLAQMQSRIHDAWDAVEDFKEANNNKNTLLKDSEKYNESLLMVVILSGLKEMFVTQWLTSCTSHAVSIIHSLACTCRSLSRQKIPGKLWQHIKRSYDEYRNETSTAPLKLSKGSHMPYLNTCAIHLCVECGTCLFICNNKQAQLKLTSPKHCPKCHVISKANTKVYLTHRSESVATKEEEASKAIHAISVNWMQPMSMLFTNGPSETSVKKHLLSHVPFRLHASEVLK